MAELNKDGELLRDIKVIAVKNIDDVIEQYEQAKIKVMMAKDLPEYEFAMKMLYMELQTLHKRAEEGKV